MGYSSLQGRARTSSSSPRGKGVCDRCGELYQLAELLQQQQWFGNTLKWDGFLVCYRCYDKPQDQLRPVHVPADPIPLKNPRPEYYYQDYGLQGFKLFNLVPYPATEADFLVQMAIESKVPTPAGYIDRSGIVAVQNATQLLLPANPSRTWLSIGNPVPAPITVSTSNVGYDGHGSIAIGGGLTMSGPDCYKGAMSFVSLFPGTPFWAFEK